MKNILMDIIKPFEYWLKTPKRTKIVFGGRGSSKSISIALCLVAMSFVLTGVILCTRETQKSIKHSIYHLIKTIIYEHNLQSYFKITKEDITNIKTGCQFIFAGLKEYSVDNIRSINNIDICFIEEGHTVSKYSNDTLRPSVRNPKSEIWWAFNPRFEYDVIYDFVKKYELKDASYFAREKGTDIVKEYPYQFYEDDEVLIYKINFDGNYFFPEVLELERQFTLKHNARDYANIWLGETVKEQGRIFLKDKLKFYEEEDLKNILDDYVNYCLIDPAFGSESCYTSAIVYKKMAGGYYLIDAGLMRTDGNRTTDEMLIEFIKKNNVKKVFCESNFAQKELIKKLSRYFTVQPFYQRINKIERIVNASYSIVEKVFFPNEWLSPPDFHDIDKWIETKRGRGFTALQQLFNFSDIKTENNKKGDPFSFVDFPDALASIIMFDKNNETYIPDSEKQNNNPLLLASIFESEEENDFKRSLI